MPLFAALFQFWIAVIECLLIAGRRKKAQTEVWAFLNSGAGNEARTRDLNLGKVALYQLSYSRIFQLKMTSHLIE